MIDRNKTEQELQHRSLTTEPRLTPDRIENKIKDEQYHTFDGSLLTVCCLTLENGFNVTGESACVSPENFDEEMGQRIARAKAVDKIWELEGYLLRQRMFESEST